MRARICGVSTAKNKDELFRTIQAAEEFRLGYLEIRFDFLRESLDPAEIRNKTSLRLIGTNRPLWEGGHFKGEENERLQILKQASEAGFDYIDLELETPEVKETCRALLGKKIISKHNFKETPSLATLESLRRLAARLKPDIIKICTTACSPKDNLTLAKFLITASSRSSLVAFCMGEYGTPTRVLGPLLGSKFVYASLFDRASSAPGQLSVEKLCRIYELMGVT